MGLLHFIYTAVVFVLLILVLAAVGVLFSKGMDSLFKHLLPKEQAERWNVLTLPITLLVGIGLFVAAMIYIVTHGPDKAELRVLLAKTFSYESTRIRIELNAISDAQRQELVTFLNPMMQAWSKEFSYYVRSRSGGGYTLRATLPSYYQLTGDRLEIATGVAIATHENTPLFQKILEQAADASKAPELPTTIEAQLLRTNKEPVIFALLPETVMLTVEEPRTLIFKAGMSMECRMTVQGLVSSDHFPLLFASGQIGVPQGIRLRVSAIDGVIPTTEYEVHALMPVPGAHGRIVKELPKDSTQIYAQLALTPVDFSNGPGCDSRLFASLNNVWINAAIRNLSPVLASAVKQVTLERSTRFSPWYADGRWNAVAQNENAKDR